VLANNLGGKGFNQVSSSAAIEAQLLQGGNGARGVVYGSYGPGTVGHVFNAVNQNGPVCFRMGKPEKQHVCWLQTVLLYALLTIDPGNVGLENSAKVGRGTDQSFRHQRW
jgi:papain fold toxin 1 (glutamine deamidase) of polymorphic toxin system